jgi:hypothetical protein
LKIYSHVILEGKGPHSEEVAEYYHSKVTPDQPDVPVLLATIKALELRKGQLVAELSPPMTFVFFPQKNISHDCGHIRP